MKNAEKKFFFSKEDNALTRLENSQMGKIYGGLVSYCQSVYTESTFVKVSVPRGL